jgi:hypothetical protein
MRRNWQASYAHGLRLKKDGCPLPDLNSLPGRQEYHQRSIYVRQIYGVESYALDFGTWVGYVIALRIGTELTRGAIITSYKLVPQWQDDEIEWGLDPWDLLAEGGVNDYGKLMDSNLRTILGDRKLLSRGRPAEDCFVAVDGSPFLRLSSETDAPTRTSISPSIPAQVHLHLYV